MAILDPPCPKISQADDHRFLSTHTLGAPRASPGWPRQRVLKSGRRSPPGAGRRANVRGPGGPFRDSDSGDRPVPPSTCLAACRPCWLLAILARRAKMTPEQRRRATRKANRARWAKKKRRGHDRRQEEAAHGDEHGRHATQGSQGPGHAVPAEATAHVTASELWPSSRSSSVLSAAGTPSGLSCLAETPSRWTVHGVGGSS